MSRVIGRAVDRGSGSLWLLGIGLAVLAFAGVVAMAGAALVAGHRAQAAADLGALAGATRAVEGPLVACRRAAAVVAANGATLVDCRTDGLDVLVDARTGAPLGITVDARARAGPAATTARAPPADTGCYCRPEV